MQIIDDDSTVDSSYNDETLLKLQKRGKSVQQRMVAKLEKENNSLNKKNLSLQQQIKDDKATLSRKRDKLTLVKQMKKNQESLCNQDVEISQLESEQTTKSVQAKRDTAIREKKVLENTVKSLKKILHSLRRTIKIIDINQICLISFWQTQRRSCRTWRQVLSRIIS